MAAKQIAVEAFTNIGSLQVVECPCLKIGDHIFGMIPHK